MTQGDPKVQCQQNLTFDADTIESPLSFKASVIAIRWTKWVLPVNSSFQAGVGKRCGVCGGPVGF